MNFNAAQQEAISFLNGPCLTLAGPGSGKTTVLTHRIRHLIKYGKVKPSEILVVTFTRAAAGEMKQRYLKLMGEERTTVTFGTFHSVFFTILKYAYHYQAENVIREGQKEALIRRLIYKHHIAYEDEKDCIRQLCSEISEIKNGNLSLQHYYSKNCAEESFRQLYTDYENFLHRERLIDFDDMLVYTYELFSKRKDILARWQQKFRYILIDEFQDINGMQYAVVRMLAQPENNLFVVGDEDQSIYGFRQANPEIMLNFFRDYPEAKKILLDVNYRSDGNIVAAAGRLIAHNTKRFEKNIRASHKAAESIVIQNFRDKKEEGLALIRALDTYRKEGGAWKDVAVLYRTNVQPRLLMQQLAEYNIPFYTKEHIPNLYDHWIVKDLETYLRIAHGSRSRSDFLQIMNRPNRYIGRVSLERESVDFETWAEFYQEIGQPWIADRIDRLKQDITMLRTMNPFAAINFIRRGIGYDDYLKEYAVKRGIASEELTDVTEELAAMVRELSSYEAWQEQKKWFLLEIENAAKQTEGDGKRVALMTLHGAKGLEYDVVFILDVNEKIMPYKKAVLEEEIEEERRMFYVGMTRAKKQLYLFHVAQINNHAMEESRFIRELQEGPGNRSMPM